MLLAQLLYVLHYPLWMPSSYPPFDFAQGRHFAKYGRMGTRCGGFCSLKAVPPALEPNC